jgi:hypothetical protein
MLRKAFLHPLDIFETHRHHRSRTLWTIDGGPSAIPFHCKRQGLRAADVVLARPNAEGDVLAFRLARQLHR